MKTSTRIGIPKSRRAGSNSRSAIHLGALGALAITVAMGLPAAAQAPSAGNPSHTAREDREPGRFEFDVTAPPLSPIRIDYSELLGGDWETVAPPVVALDSLTPMSVPLTEGETRGFFRAVVEPPQVSVYREQGELVLNMLGDEVGLDEILIGLSHELGEVPFY